ncbi:unnamed protein product [Absidia cylindrospora]
MVLWTFALLIYCCQAQLKSSDSILSTPTIPVTSSSIETESAASTLITIYPQRWPLIIGVVFFSATIFLFIIAAGLAIYMKRCKWKSKEGKSIYYNDSIFIHYQQPIDKSSVCLNRLFPRNKQLPPIIDPQLQSAIQNASMLPY